MTNSRAVAHKAEWRDASLARWDFSRSNMHNRIHFRDQDFFIHAAASCNMRPHVRRCGHMLERVACYKVQAHDIWCSRMLEGAAAETNT